MTLPSLLIAGLIPDTKGEEPEAKSMKNTPRSGTTSRSTAAGATLTATGDLEV
jgi:hypothetical protein